MVKRSSEEAAFRYLQKNRQKGTKGAKINYKTLEIQDYLQPCSNIKIEEQRYLFSLRSEMNKIKANFSKNPNIEPSFCIEKCMVEMNNEHLVWCDKLNTNSELKYSELLNGDFTKKTRSFETSKRKLKKKRSRKESPVIQYLYC